MKKLPLGIQDFTLLRREDNVFVDKTGLIHQLINLNSRYIYFSRPPRFGKSLLVSILKEIFSGNRNLFTGLWIEDQIPWKPYPVIHLDFLNIANTTPELLETGIDKSLSEAASALDADISAASLKKRIYRLIKTIHKSTKSPIVVLMDNFDKPVADQLAHPITAAANQEIMASLGEALKSVSGSLRFVFLTGVSKGANVASFSGFDHLTDISLDPRFATLTGFTGEEAFDCFSDLITAHHLDFSEIKKWYNGYSWDGKNFVLNPGSLLDFLDSRDFMNFQQQYGIPKLLMNALRATPFDPASLKNISVPEEKLMAPDLVHPDIVSLLFQTGYLTIKEKKGADDMHRLDFPNLEMEMTFRDKLLPVIQEERQSVKG